MTPPSTQHVLIIHEVADYPAWISLDNARRFFDSPKLERIRVEAGVKSPEFIDLKQLEAGIL
ncbi:hypothetical protein VB716_04300 [Synechococcus sp. CCY9201]|uniref:hypothetical protein n=1 Tax=Synechococcus sp. CCY9201 TaxID=174697 RepID=UPI002B1F5BC2|nr:hypothetical protein [Synechococcus sp. CCY9201]MEA5473437.1 hypothetical protein [Synechococcus sp. CCY9201]